MTVQENINNGVYNNTMEYPKAPAKPVLVKNATPTEIRAYADAIELYDAAYDVYKSARIAYSAETTAKHNQFRSDLETEYRTTGHPKANLLWTMAWDEGHSSGLNEVFNWYDRLSDLVI